jgi:hypothetical protein
MRTLILVFAGCVLASGLLAGEKKAKDAKGEFKMNPKLANLGEDTWLKMSPKFVYHPDQVARLRKVGRDIKKVASYGGGRFCHSKGEASLSYDESVNRAIYFGGCSTGYGNNLWVYDCSGDVWTQVHPDIFDYIKDKKGRKWRYRKDPKSHPPGCCYTSMCYDSDMKVSLFCRPNKGATAWAPNHVYKRPPNNHAWLYDARKKKWIFTERKGILPKVYVTGVRWAYDPVKKECVLAGSGSLWAYKTAENTWRKITPKGTDAKPGNASCWVYMSKQKKFLLFKALKKKSASNATTWFYDHATEVWEDVTPKKGPAKRQSAAMCYDSLNNVAIMISGWEGKPSVKLKDGTWVFDPAKRTWTQMKAKPCPGPSGSCYQMAYDKINNVAVYVIGSRTWVYRYKRREKQ